MHECSGNIFQEALETEKAEGTSTATIMIVNPLPFFLSTSITHRWLIHLIIYCSRTFWIKQWMDVVYLCKVHIVLQPSCIILYQAVYHDWAQYAMYPDYKLYPVYFSDGQRLAQQFFMYSLNWTYIIIYLDWDS